jgi:acetylornithine deacetylase
MSSALPFPEDRELLDAGDPLAWTRALVAVPSVNPELEPGGSGEAGVADLIAPFLRSWGFRVERHEPRPGRVSLVARLGDSAPVLALCGHLDTVGVGGMTIPPFAPGDAGDGRVRGRGSADMKSGVAAVLAAAAATARAGGPRQGSLALVLTADEEHASLGLEALLAGGLRADGVVVTEPTELALSPANRGFVWIEVVARGRAAHGSRPEVGRDAVRQVGRLLAALDTLDEGGGALRLGDGAARHPLLGTESLHAGTIAGGEAPSVYPAHCRLVLEARVLPGRRPEEVVEAVADLARGVEARYPGVPLEVTGGLSRPGADLPGDAPLVEALRRALAATGVPERTEGMTAWVESAWFVEAGIPALCFGPGSIARAHTADEWVAVQEIEAAARVLTHLAGEGLAP